jgi:hypothetical protein
MALLLIGVLPPGAPAVVPDVPHVRVACGERIALALGVEDDVAGQDEACIVDWARRQNEVLSAHVPHGDVLPVRIGSVFSGAGALAAHVARAAPGFGPVERRLEGCVEYAVKVVPLAGPAAAADRAVEATGYGEGAAFLRRRRGARDLRQQAGKRRLEFIEDLGLALASRARSVVRHDARGRAALADWSVLLPRTQSAAFLARLDLGLAEARAQNLSLRVIGPWPAFSFVEGVAADA